MDYATYLRNLMANLNPDVQAGMLGGAVQLPQGFVMPQPTPTFATQPPTMPLPPTDLASDPLPSRTPDPRGIDGLVRLPENLFPPEDLASDRIPLFPPEDLASDPNAFRAPQTWVLPPTTPSDQTPDARLISLPGKPLQPQTTPSNQTPAAPIQPQRELTDIEKLYQDVLGRAPDTGGSDYWTKQFLEDGTIDATERKTFERAALPEIELTKLYQNDERQIQVVLNTGTSSFDGVLDENERKTSKQH
jgi:hypothetical protein